MPRLLPPSELGKAQPRIMGIINVTPDSFSGDGLFLSSDYVCDAVAVALQMVRDGATILDIGGESTRPGALAVSIEDEIQRTVPVIAALAKEIPHIALSIDTMKPEVARAALAAGASLINDVSGIKQDPDMRVLAASSGAYLVLMHNAAQAQEVTQTQTIGGEYLASACDDVVATVAQELAAMASQALSDGVAEDKIILDPGIGFGKTLEQNLQLINQLDRFVPLGFPLLLGASRKSFIGRVLDLPPEDRLEGTAAAVALGTLRGASILRVHDVKFMARLVRMMHALQTS